MGYGEKSDTEKALERSHGIGQLYCYRCRTYQNVKLPTNNEPAVLQKCGCGAALVEWNITRLAHLLYVQDQILQDGIRAARSAETLKRDLDTANARNAALIESDRRSTREMESFRNTCYHPATHSFVAEGQTASAGLMRMRVGWEGPCFRLHNAEDMVRMENYYTALGRESAGSAPAHNTQLQRELSQAQIELARLRLENQTLRAANAATPTRSRRHLEA